MYDRIPEINNCTVIKVDEYNYQITEDLFCYRNKLIFSCSISLEFLLNNLLTLDFMFILTNPLMSKRKKFIKHFFILFLLLISDVTVNVI